MEPHPLTLYRRQHNLTLEALSARLGVGRSALCKWERRRVPAERALDVERVTGISRHLLRPDIFLDLQAETSDAKASLEEEAQGTAVVVGGVHGPEHGRNAAVRHAKPAARALPAPEAVR